MALRTAVKQLLRRALDFLGPPPRPPARGVIPPAGERRFVRVGTDGSAGDYLRAAETYVAGRDPEAQAWFFAKPFDPAPGNPAFYYEHYQVLNLLGAMALPHRGRILEVGCGPGWISEMLVLLRFDVTGIDPSADMLDIARQRVDGSVKHRRAFEPGSAEFVHGTIEDSSLPESQYDGMLYHEALHHVLDERCALAKTFRALKPGGVLGVCEWAWAPGEEKLESELRQEMAEFGTLESPFTRRYLDYLLTDIGFVDIERYHGINGLFPETQGGVALRDLAQEPATSTNTLTARKPDSAQAPSL